MSAVWSLLGIGQGMEFKDILASQPGVQANTMAPELR